MGKIGVILSGCGRHDGSEIHEATLTLLHLSKAGLDYRCYAPDIRQTRVVDHVSGQESSETRNVLSEAARIARGEISPLLEAQNDDLDAAVLPGGLGAALNLCDYASAGPDCTLNADLEALLSSLFDRGRPIVAICIAPPILARLFRNKGIRGARLTIGNDPEHAGNLESMGATHVECPATECLVDPALRVITTPAYMLARSVAELDSGIAAAIAALRQYVG